MRGILLGLAILALAGCATSDGLAYARNVPSTCDEILIEAVGLGGEISMIQGARTVKNAAIGVAPFLVAAGYLHPVFAIAAPAARFLELDDAGRQKRSDFLIDRYYSRGCPPL